VGREGRKGVRMKRKGGKGREGERKGERRVNSPSKNSSHAVLPDFFHGLTLGPISHYLHSSFSTLSSLLLPIYRMIYAVD